MIQAGQVGYTPIAGQEQWQYFSYEWVPGDEEPGLYMVYVLDNLEEFSAAEVSTTRPNKSDTNTQFARPSRE